MVGAGSLDLSSTTLCVSIDHEIASEKWLAHVSDRPPVSLYAVRLANPQVTSNWQLHPNPAVIGM
jgi:hypothetical protein